MQYNILVIGDKGVGKNSYINRHIGHSFGNNLSNNKTNKLLNFNASNGYDKKTNKIVNLKIDIYDDLSFINNGVVYNGVIIMFDRSGDETYNITKWINNTKDIPYRCVCGNKVDKRSDQFNDIEKINNILSNKIEYIDLSAKSCYNFEKPFLYLLRNIMEDSSLVFAHV